MDSKLAPVSAVMVMLTKPAAARAGMSKMTCELLSLVTRVVAATPLTSTVSICAPPPRRLVPDTVTRVLKVPTLGCTCVTFGAARYVKPPAEDTSAPVDPVMTTSPAPGASASRATATTVVAFAVSTCARTPARLTERAVGALPRRRSPVMTTRVPATPLLGSMVAITPMAV